LAGGSRLNAGWTKLIAIENTNPILYSTGRGEAPLPSRRSGVGDALEGARAVRVACSLDGTSRDGCQHSGSLGGVTLVGLDTVPKGRVRRQMLQKSHLAEATLFGLCQAPAEGSGRLALLCRIRDGARAHHLNSSAFLLGFRGEVAPREAIVREGTAELVDRETRCEQRHGVSVDVKRVSRKRMR